MNNDIVNEILLVNLSFYEWMNIENILISIDKRDLVLIGDITLDELNDHLKRLIKEGLLESHKRDGELKYKRLFKRSFISRVKNFLK